MQTGGDQHVTSKRRGSSLVGEMIEGDIRIESMEKRRTGSVRRSERRIGSATEVSEVMKLRWDAS